MIRRLLTTLAFGAAHLHTFTALARQESLIPDDSERSRLTDRLSASVADAANARDFPFV